MLVMLTPRKRSAKRNVKVKDLHTVNNTIVAQLITGMLNYCQAKNEDLELH